MTEGTNSSEDDIRALMTDAIDGTLSSEQKVVFDRVLEQSDALRREYEEMRSLVTRISQEKGPPPAAPDLTASVQRTIRVRSRGKFFRDRFSERSQGTSTGVVASVTVVLVVFVTIILLREFGYL